MFVSRLLDKNVWSIVRKLYRGSGSGDIPDLRSPVNGTLVRHDSGKVELLVDVLFRNIVTSSSLDLDVDYIDFCVLNLIKS